MIYVSLKISGSRFITLVISTNVRYGLHSAACTTHSRRRHHLLMLLSVNVCDSCYQALTIACFSSAIGVKLHHDVIKAGDNEYGSNKISAILPLNSVIEFSTCCGEAGWPRF